MPQGLGNYNPVMGGRNLSRCSQIEGHRQGRRGIKRMKQSYSTFCVTAPHPQPRVPRKQTAWDSPLPTQTETRETRKQQAYEPPATSPPFSFERT